MEPTQDLNILDVEPLISPKNLKKQLPLSAPAHKTVTSSRAIIQSILSGTDRRVLVVVGPCSIYDSNAAIDYAQRLAALRAELPNLYLVMRGYFEKPRTTVGWKGFVNDPLLDGKGDIQLGLRMARQLLVQITELGLPIATEVLDPIVPQYLADLVSWASIGARTTESQTHREMASGLSMPVGFKNSTEGNLDVAINAMQAAQHSHSFLGINQDGQTAIVKTRGNRWGHIILRGGKTPNYDQATIDYATTKMIEAGFKPAMMVDCSHGNSNKQHQRQVDVARSVLGLIQTGSRQIIGLMIESNLHDGSQKITSDITDLQYGVSITDACIGWETTEALLRELNNGLSLGLDS